MILVDIQVPIVNRTYDFELDDEMKTGELIREITGIIVEKEKLEEGVEGEMHLYSMFHEKILNEQLTLKQQGIGSGEKLYLI